LSAASVRETMKPPGLVWLLLSLILAGYVGSVVRLHPQNFFGLTEDDSIYFSSAKALALGQGYILPSIPGTPPATKYPILYPLILSVVWKLNPSFPANLAWAIAITVAFGFVYLAAGFLFLRRLRLLHDAEALLLTAFCAFHPVVLFYSASVLSDIPFAALTLIAMLLADSMLEPTGRPQLAMLCGVVAGASMLMRMFGLAIVAGILLATLLRRARKRALLFCAAVAPFFLVVVWRVLFSPSTAAPISARWLNSPAWANAWAYYTNYLTMWKMGVPNEHVFWTMVQSNFGALVIGPADLFLSPILIGHLSFVRTFAALFFLTLMLCGMARQARVFGWKPVHYILPFYLGLIVFWNFPDAGNRFLLPFAFFIAAGIWMEMKNLFCLLQTKLSSATSSRFEKGIAGMLNVAILFTAFVTALAYISRDPGKLASLSHRRASLLPAKQEAYQWLSGGVCCSPVLAYEDVNVYLYSGRSAMRPVLFPTSAIYEPNREDESLNHVMDIPEALDAQYWLFSEDDYSVDFQKAADALSQCLGPSGPADLPVVFKSRDGRVVIRSLQGSTYTNPCKRTGP
jgi:hypothetical protein